MLNYVFVVCRIIYFAYFYYAELCIYGFLVKIGISNFKNCKYNGL